MPPTTPSVASSCKIFVDESPYSYGASVHGSCSCYDKCAVSLVRSLFKCLCSQWGCVAFVGFRMLFVGHDIRRITQQTARHAMFRSHARMCIGLRLSSPLVTAHHIYKFYITVIQSQNIYLSNLASHEKKSI